MTGVQFEEFLYLIFEKMGYKTLLTKRSGDQGVDLILKKGTNKIGVQAKRSTGKIGNSAVQEIVAGLKYYDCNSGIVVTNSTYTNSAISLADSNNIVTLGSYDGHK